MTQKRWSTNRLLLALPSFTLERLGGKLDTVDCRNGQVLVDPDSAIEEVFFPDDGLISVAAVYDGGKIGEVTIIGREGCTGVDAILGADRSCVRMKVQIPGRAMRMKLGRFDEAMKSLPEFRLIMHTYAQAYVDELMLSVACRSAHSLLQRLARWLLMIRDACEGDDLPISQQQLAALLGVHRPSITNAAQELESKGLIVRGIRQVTVRDRVALTHAACECYTRMRARNRRRRTGHPQAGIN